MRDEDGTGAWDATPAKGVRRVKHRTIWLVWLVPVALATAVAMALFFAERISGETVPLPVQSEQSERQQRRSVQ